MRKGISEILSMANDAKTPSERTEILKRNDSPTLRTLLTYAFDKDTIFELPEGEPPYKPNEYPGQQGNLYGEMRRMYLFIKGGNPNLTKMKREMLFIQMLEMLDPEDAKLMCSIKDKKLPYKNINKNLIKKTFPNLNI